MNPTVGRGFQNYPAAAVWFKPNDKDVPNLAIGAFNVIGPYSNAYDCHNYALGFKKFQYRETGDYSRALNAAGYDFLAGVPLVPGDGEPKKRSSADFAFVKGQQKIVIFQQVNDKGEPYWSHSAVQNPVTGLWESKLGAHPLIAHRTLAQISGGIYGQPAAVYKRVIKE